MQQRESLGFFAHRFCCHFKAHGFTNRSKSWIQLRSNNVHYLFFWVQKAAIYDLSWKLVLAWKCCDLDVFATIVGRKTSPERFVITFLHLLIYNAPASTDNFAGLPEHSRVTMEAVTCSFLMTQEMLAKLTNKPPLFGDLNIPGG